MNYNWLKFIKERMKGEQDMITEDYVSFEVAKLLKEKGFNEPTFTYYNNTGGIMTSYDFCGDYISGRFNNIKDKKVNCAAPTLQMAMKWFREVHNIHIKVHCSGNRNYLIYAQSLVTAFHDFCIESATCSFNTYEEACEAALKYCLTNLIK